MMMQPFQCNQSSIKKRLIQIIAHFDVSKQWAKEVNNLFGIKPLARKV